MIGNNGLFRIIFLIYISLNICAQFELSKNSIEWVVFKSRITSIYKYQLKIGKIWPGAPNLLYDPKTAFIFCLLFDSDSLYIIVYITHNKN